MLGSFDVLVHIGRIVMLILTTRPRTPISLKLIVSLRVLMFSQNVRSDGSRVSFLVTSQALPTVHVDFSLQLLQ